MSVKLLGKIWKFPIYSISLHSLRQTNRKQGGGNTDTTTSETMQR